MKLYQERTIEKDQILKQSVLGIPLAYEDITSTQLFISPNSNVDGAGSLPFKSDYTTSQLVINLDFEFKQKVATRYYFKRVDFLAQLGGILALTIPCFEFFAPFFIVIFLYKMCQIILDKHRRAYREELLELFGKSLGQVKRIRELLHTPAGAAVSVADEIPGREAIVTEADEFLVHCAVDDANEVEEAYTNELTYSNERLEGLLDEIIAFIKKTQKVMVQTRGQPYNNEFEKIN